MKEPVLTPHFEKVIWFKVIKEGKQYVTNN